MPESLSSAEPPCGSSARLVRYAALLTLLLFLLFLLFLGLGSVLACRPSRPTGAPADAVQRFYAAATAGDCAAALTTLGSKLRARLDSGDRCALLFRQTLEHPLERVLGTQADGRDPKAQLVRARLSGRAIDLIIRVEAEEGQWKIVSM